MGVEIYYAGKSYIIDSEQHQILDMLMSTFEHAVQQGRELIKMQLELKTFNEQLEEKVKERTAALKRSEDALRQAYDDLRQTQQMVMQQERLRALGQMASGIVHDINNTLSPIVVYTNLLLTSEPNLSERTKRYLRNIQTAGTDISHIVARMREFYRQREGRELLFPVSLNPLVRQVLELTRPCWRDIPQERGVVMEMHTELDPGLPSVSGIESEIREALTNLIFNAMDAMPQGGVVTIRTREGAGGHGGQEEGAPPQVVLEVSDTGAGMDEETRQHCLEPFFSTKGERGTGLGLAMVYGVMQRHQGDIHDIGKIGVPAEILSKSGRINVHEFDFIKTHAQVGYDLLKGLEFPWPVAQAALQHHERLNGSGYPGGLSLGEIILEAWRPVQSFLPKRGLSLSDDWGWCWAEICREFTLPCRPSTSDKEHYVNLIGEGGHRVPPLIFALKFEPSWPIDFTKDEVVSKGSYFQVGKSLWFMGDRWVTICAKAGVHYGEKEG
ncbi:MAG: HD domain-containing protein [Nitrospinae bacterium]|nr:HD domain-containing protein [Nitrospinota bacterium]